MKLHEVMQHSGVAFGTSGARGLVTAMTDDVCAAYTMAFIQTVRPSFEFEKVAIAVDLRPSSLRIADACAKMLRQLGLEVVFCGAIPTPALALYAQSLHIPGLMVTGSHIPFDRNGLKFYRPDGEITKSDEQAMLSCDCPDLHSQETVLPVEDAAARTVYLQRYLDWLGPNALRGMRLALYQHSSVGRDLMHDLLTQLGAEVLCLERSDIFVPIDTEAVSAEDVQRGLQWAQTYQVDAIISTDGDGDRPLISDERGVWLRGDVVGLLTAKALGIRHLAVPVSCNTAIERSGAFESVQRTKIGSPFVIAAMQALLSDGATAVAGFEANGGFLLGSMLSEQGLQALPTRDAVLPVVALLAQANASARKLSTMVADLPPRFTASDRLQAFPTEKSKALLARWSTKPALVVQEMALSEEVAHMDYTDGLRLTLQSGRIVHFRPSGNAPEFRCYVEAHSPESAADLLALMMNRLRAFV